MPLTVDQIEQIAELEASGVPLMTCLSCGQQLPVTAEYWFFNGKLRSDVCKDCTRQESSQRANLPIPAEMIRKLVGGEIIDSSGVSHLRDEVRLQFGGVRGIAAQLKLDYDSAKPGSNARVQLMKSILQLEAEADKAKRSTGRLDTDPEDLLRVLEQALNQKPGSLKGLAHVSDE
jgi:hypothetical protein